MTEKDTRQYTMLMRVREFGDVNKGRFAHSELARAKFAEVEDAVARLREHAVSKMSASAKGRTTKVSAREALIEELSAVHRTAQAVALSTPGLKDAFRMPSRWTDQTLLTAGRLFVRDAAAYAAAFVLHGLPPTFIADLQARVEQFDRAIRDRQAEQGGHAAARGHITAALTAGLTAVRVLDAIVANELRHDAVALAAWRRDRHVARARSATVVASLPAPTPAPAEEAPSPPQA